MTRIVLRADDLGYSRGVNCGLAWACDNGLPMSIGLMVNFPAARSDIELVAYRELKRRHPTGLQTVCESRFDPCISKIGKSLFKQSCEWLR